MFEEGIPVAHITRHIAFLHNDFKTDHVLDRMGEKVEFRIDNLGRNARRFFLINLEQEVLLVSLYVATHAGTFRNRPQFIFDRNSLPVKNDEGRCFGHISLLNMYTSNRAETEHAHTRPISKSLS